MPNTIAIINATILNSNLIPGPFYRALDRRRPGQRYAFIYGKKLFRLINMSETALPTLQLLELNPHDHPALPPIVLFGAMRTKRPL